MGYSWKYDTSYDDETGEWLESIGFCPESDECVFCESFNKDGRPQTVFEAPDDAK